MKMLARETSDPGLDQCVSVEAYQPTYSYMKCLLRPPQPMQTEARRLL